MARSVWVGLICGIALSAAAIADERRALARAEKHFRADRQAHFNAEAAKIGETSVYAPLLAYWRGGMELRRHRPEAAEGVVRAVESPYLRDAMRRRLLEFYAARKNWAAFAAHAKDGGECAAALAAMRAGGSVVAAVRKVWLADRRMNDALCMRMYRLGKARGVLSDDDVWVKIRSLAGAKELSATKRLLRSFPGYVRYADARAVANRAARYIRRKHGLRTRENRELVMIAAMAAARSEPRTAIARWRQFSVYFSEAENDHVWTTLAMWAARWHRDDALSLYGRAAGAFADDDARAWRARAGLRAGDDDDVLRTITAMPEEQRRVSAWRYWRAVMLARRGEGEAAAKEMRALAADEDDYYGLLAREEVGAPLLPASPAPPAVGEAAGDFALALAIYDAGLTALAMRVWNHAMQDAVGDDRRLLSAARQAAAADWHLASVNAANKSTDAAAHALRFPLPYADDILRRSRERGLDAAFVYGLIRQESRFMPKIVSSASARGLMQVMPRTARHVARRNGYSKYRLSRLTRVDTNVIIGTTYLAELADMFAAAPARVAAGYNAGPARVRRWYRASPELTVTIENIPLTETRLYVKNVLANRAHYAARLGDDIVSMRASLSRPMRAAGAGGLSSAR